MFYFTVETQLSTSCRHNYLEKLAFDSSMLHFVGVTSDEIVL